MFLQSKNCRLCSKNCRLKITVKSKNYGLKIPVRARMYARMYVRAYARASDCRQIVIRTHDHDRHTSGAHDQDRHTTRTRTHDRNTRPPEKRGTPASGKPEYICMIADDEKKYKKS